MDISHPCKLVLDALDTKAIRESGENDTHLTDNERTTDNAAAVPVTALIQCIEIQTDLPLNVLPFRHPLRK